MLKNIALYLLLLCFAPLCMGDDRAPQIHGAKVSGVRPGTELIFPIPVTGERPLTFTADGLPNGLALDATTGIIRGAVREKGEYVVILHAANSHGKADSKLRIVVGNTLALTPPLGWMSWNLFGPEVSEALLKGMADAMVTSGMRDAGFQYIAIDDLWQGGRDIVIQSDTDGELRPDPKRFPHGIRPVADYLHERGLKLAIYSDAAAKTCGKQPGSLGFEEIDAKTFSSWGIDYLKYDYCFAPKSPEAAFERYNRMARALQHQNRSIVFGICEWGQRQPWLWGEKAGGNLWRTTWDVRDTWNSGIYDDGHAGILDILDREIDLAPYAGPGHWNDPDMLVVGLYGKGKYTSPNHLPAPGDVEYRSQISLWSLLSAPLFATNDLRSMNAATREILTNAEVLAIDQDELGRQATRVAKHGDIEIWSKELADGSRAVGLLNRGTGKVRSKTNWSELGISGPRRVRDLWQHKDLGEFQESIELEVGAHETKLLRIS